MMKLKENPKTLREIHCKLSIYEGNNTSHFTSDKEDLLIYVNKMQRVLTIISTNISQIIGKTVQFIGYLNLS